MATSPDVPHMQPTFKGMTESGRITLHLFTASESLTSPPLFMCSCGWLTPKSLRRGVTRQSIPYSGFREIWVGHPESDVGQQDERPYYINLLEQRHRGIDLLGDLLDPPVESLLI